MRTPELEARHRASVVVGHMMLICCQLLLQGYNRGKNAGAIWPEMLVIITIRINDGRKKRKPICIPRLVKITHLPRETVRRCVSALIKHGVVEKVGGGYIGTDSYIQARMHSSYFKRVVKTIRIAARELEKFK